MPVTRDDFQRDKLEDYLQFLVTVVDDQGKTIAQGREVQPLQEKFLATTKQVAEPEGVIQESWSRQSMKNMDIDSLPREVVRNRGGVKVAQYPALVDQGDGVSTCLMADEKTAEAVTRQGTMRLFAITEKKELRGQIRWLPGLDQAKIKLSGIVSASSIETQLIDLLARIAFAEREPVIRSKSAFEARRSERGTRIAKATQEVAVWLPLIADAYFAARKEIESMKGARYADATKDIASQISWLAPNQFLSFTPWAWLTHYPRYFAAITYRLDKVRTGAAARDGEAMATIHRLRDRWLASLSEAERNPKSQADSELRWMMEELRVSMFAQPLGTSIKVSPQRVEKSLQARLQP